MVVSEWLVAVLCFCDADDDDAVEREPPFSVSRSLVGVDRIPVHAMSLRRSPYPFGSLMEVTSFLSKFMLAMAVFSILCVLASTVTFSRSVN